MMERHGLVGNPTESPGATHFTVQGPVLMTPVPAAAATQAVE